MADLRQWEKRILELEERVRKLERRNDWEEELYKKARELVVKHDKASVLFLQKKLLIDYERAARLLEELETKGVVGLAAGLEPRKILVEK